MQFIFDSFTLPFIYFRSYTKNYNKAPRLYCSSINVDEMSITNATCFLALGHSYAHMSVIQIFPGRGEAEGDYLFFEFLFLILANISVAKALI